MFYAGRLFSKSKKQNRIVVLYEVYILSINAEKLATSALHIRDKKHYVFLKCSMMNVRIECRLEHGISVYSSLEIRASKKT